MRASSGYMGGPCRHTPLAVLATPKTFAVECIAALARAPAPRRCESQLI